MSYDPFTGANWDKAAADAEWSNAMVQSQPRWQLRGKPGSWRWAFFNFGPWIGVVTAEDDGFHWRTINYDNGQEILSGITTSVFKAYQSVERNQEVKDV